MADAAVVITIEIVGARDTKACPTAATAGARLAIAWCAPEKIVTNVP
jgi:hypothetical protein